MKIQFFCVALLFLSLSVRSYAQDFSNPVEYLNYIGAEYSKISREQWDYIKSMGRGKSDKVVEKRRGELLTAIANSKRTISRMPPYNKNPAFRDTVISFLRVSQIVISEDYAKIVNMEEVAEQSYDLMEAYMLAKEKASDKLTEAFERVQTEYDLFIVQNNIKVTDAPETKLSRKMREAGDVFEYYRNVYLIFFKPYKQDAYLIDALNAGNVNAVEQNRSAMLNYSLDGKEKIKEHLSFKGDATLSTACREALTFYQNEAEKYVPTVLEFLTVKDKFERIKKSFDMIKPAARKQSDIDTYNNAINEYNAVLKKYNESNDKVNDARKKMLDNWNKKVSDFFQKHMP